MQALTAQLPRQVRKAPELLCGYYTISGLPLLQKSIIVWRSRCSLWDLQAGGAEMALQTGGCICEKTDIVVRSIHLCRRKNLQKCKTVIN